jgi:hypothetical protein
MGANLQPIFTSTPVFETVVINPVIASSNYNPNTFFNGSSNVFTATDNYGTLINKITISSTGDTTNTAVSAKLVYIYLCKYGNSPALYRTVSMPATTISDTVPNPTIEIETNDLHLNANDKIYVAASANFSTASSYADYLAITIEGGSYQS